MLNNQTSTVAASIDSGGLYRSKSSNTPDFSEGSEREYTLYEEVAAILEYEGGYSRQVAERLAYIRVCAPPEVPYLLLQQFNQRLILNKKRLGLETISDSLLIASMLGIDESDQFFVPLFGESAKCIGYEKRSRIAVERYLTELSHSEQMLVSLTQLNLKNQTQSKEPS